MRLRLLLIGAVACACSALPAQADAAVHRTSVTIPVADYEIRAEPGGANVVVEGFGSLLIPGKPELPSRIFAIAIPPGVVHQIANTADRVLKFLCCCAPAYEHDDTVLAE